MSTTRVTATGATTAPARADRGPDGSRPPSHALPRPRRLAAPRPGADPAPAHRDHHPYRIAEEPHP
ncbi:hypothetical protein [Streptomyces sp. NPDC002602]|uniref:hypothetical protein n=1 Tax=Streptomyces sp. NPDC002602 TaxID=3364654 RepID=UPI00368BB824